MEKSGLQFKNTVNVDEDNKNQAMEQLKQIIIFLYSSPVRCVAKIRWKNSRANSLIMQTLQTLNI